MTKVFNPMALPDDQSDIADDLTQDILNLCEDYLNRYNLVGNRVVVSSLFTAYANIIDTIEPTPNLEHLNSLECHGHLLVTEVFKIIRDEDDEDETPKI